MPGTDCGCRFSFPSLLRKLEVRDTACTLIPERTSDESRIPKTQKPHGHVPVETSRPTRILFDSLPYQDFVVRHILQFASRTPCTVAAKDESSRIESMPAILMQQQSKAVLLAEVVARPLLLVSSSTAPFR